MMMVVTAVIVTAVMVETTNVTFSLHGPPMVTATVLPSMRLVGIAATQGTIPWLLLLLGVAMKVQDCLGGLSGVLNPICLSQTTELLRAGPE